MVPMPFSGVAAGRGRRSGLSLTTEGRPPTRLRARAGQAFVGAPRDQLPDELRQAREDVEISCTSELMAHELASRVAEVPHALEGVADGSADGSFRSADPNVVADRNGPPVVQPPQT